MHTILAVQKNYFIQVWKIGARASYSRQPLPVCDHMILSLHLIYEYVHLYSARVKNNRYTGQLSMNLFWNIWKPFHAFSGAQGYPLLLCVCALALRGSFMPRSGTVKEVGLETTLSADILGQLLSQPGPALWAGHSSTALQSASLLFFYPITVLSTVLKYSPDIVLSILGLCKAQTSFIWLLKAYSAGYTGNNWIPNLGEQGILPLSFFW